MCRNYGKRHTAAVAIVIQLEKMLEARRENESYSSSAFGDDD